MNVLVLPVILAFLVSSAVGRDLTDEEWIQNYFSSLESSSYNKLIEPEGSEGQGAPLKIRVSMYILDIHKVDDTSMDYNAHFYFRQSWKDPRLQYKRNIDSLILRNVESIWTPDLFFVEERHGSLHKIIHPNIFCKIKPDGEVLFSSKLSLLLSCPMDLRNYPHDIQKCEISIESYGYQRKHIDLEWLNSEYKPVTFSQNITMLEYDLVGVIPSMKYAEFTSGNYSRLVISLSFKRKIGLFVTRLYVPFVILVLMSSLSLWIRAEERCLRLALLLVIIYLMVTISTIVNSLIPPAPYTKAIDVWIGFCESLVFAVFLEFVAVALIAGKRKNEGTSESKGEILLTLDPEAKECSPNLDSPKSAVSKLVNMFDAKRGGGRRKRLSHRIDKICRLVFPAIFVIFNIIYWSVYCAA